MITRASRVFPGQEDQVAHARAFVKSSCGSCPMLDEAVLLTSELCTNAVRHSASGDGGSFEVIVRRRGNSLRVEVRDDGSNSVSVARDYGELAENGRGLEIVALLANRWGQSRTGYGRLVFFELRWGSLLSSSGNAPAGVSPFAHPVQPGRGQLRGTAARQEPARANPVASPQKWPAVIDGQRLRELQRSADPASLLAPSSAEASGLPADGRGRAQAS